MSACARIFQSLFISFRFLSVELFTSPLQLKIPQYLFLIIFIFTLDPYHINTNKTLFPSFTLTNLFLARKCPVISLFENLVQYDHLYKYPQALPSLYLYLVNTNNREVRRNQFDNLHQFYLTESCYNNIIERPSHMCKIRHGRLIDW